MSFPVVVLPVIGIIILCPFDDFVACRRRVLRLDTGFGRGQRDIERQNAGVLGVAGHAQFAVLHTAGERQHGFCGVPAIGAAFECARERAVRRVQRVAAGQVVIRIAAQTVDFCGVALESATSTEADAAPLCDIGKCKWLATTQSVVSSESRMSEKNLMLTSYSVKSVGAAARSFACAAW